MRIVLLILGMLMFNATLFGQTTKVYLFRHAEKETQNPKDRNPNLNMDGHKRAARLDKMFKNKSVDAVFSTSYKRTEQTIKPLVETHQLSIQKYDAKNLKALASKITTQYQGKNVIVVGHSNTLFPLAKALGVENSDSEIPETDYSTYIVVKLKRNKVSLSTKQY